eukprot:PhM_4_TR9512/c0_g1_i1/m.57729
MFREPPQRSVIIESTFLLIKPDAISHQPAILDEIQQRGFLIEARTMVFTKVMAELLVEHYVTIAAKTLRHHGPPSHTTTTNNNNNNGTAVAPSASGVMAVPSVDSINVAFSTSSVIMSSKEEEARLEKLRTEHMEHLLGGTVLAVVLTRENAVAALRDLCGPSDPIAAKRAYEDAVRTKPDTVSLLRARYGKTEVLNAVHCSANTERAALEIQKIMGLKASQRTVAVPSASSAASDTSRMVELMEADVMDLVESDVEDPTVALRAKKDRLRRAQHNLRRRELDLLLREKKLLDLVQPTKALDRHMLRSMRAQDDTLADLSDVVNNPLACRRLFDAIDTNKNGHVSLNELIASFEHSSCLRVTSREAGAVQDMAQQVKAMLKKVRSQHIDGKRSVGGSRSTTPGEGGGGGRVGGRVQIIQAGADPAEVVHVDDDDAPSISYDEFTVILMKIASQ